MEALIFVGAAILALVRYSFVATDPTSGASWPSRARIALAICEVEAGLRSPLQLEQRCHLTLWLKLVKRLRRSSGPAVRVRSLVGVIAQEHVPGLAEVTVLIRRAGRVVPVALSNSPYS